MHACLTFRIQYGVSFRARPCKEHFQVLRRSFICQNKKKTPRSLEIHKRFMYFISMFDNLTLNSVSAVLHGLKSGRVSKHLSFINCCNYHLNFSIRLKTEDVYYLKREAHLITLNKCYRYSPWHSAF
jgi:hypothetical protein